VPRERIGRRLLAVGVVTVLVYVALFAWIEHRRNRLGPWEVVFTRTPDQLPCVEIHQPKLDIRDVRLVFPNLATAGEQSLPVRETFDEARPTPFDLPLGRCVFLDTISLPGNVTIEVGGHQVQLLPRMLTVDGVERPWQSGITIAIGAAKP
jgi:hypothetical protein